MNPADNDPQPEDRPIAVISSRHPRFRQDPLEEFGDHVHRIICAMLIVVQCASLDYYLVKYNNNNLYFLWLIADAAILGYLAFAFIVTFLYKRGCPSRFVPYPAEGILPYAYSVWGLYAGCLVGRVAPIYIKIAPALTESIFFGRNSLRVTVGLTAPVAYFLLRSLVLARPFEQRNNIYLLRLSMEIILDILDAVDFMDHLFIASSRTTMATGMVNAVVAFGCITLLCPLILLAVYNNCHFVEPRGVARGVKALHLILGALLVNVPMLVIRLVLWHHNRLAVSAFLLKNLLFTFMYVVDIVRLIIYNPKPAATSDGKTLDSFTQESAK